ncbi:SDR family oxidoreductase [Lacticaseibacillus baoqingensis]|uniref:SDR family oxidoreductase n=1 Tax=Lacticaseibacillus baoqingensis TaxID=2486013 RepID=A0ABW4E8U4_9LACO|nr:SDR family oxidoreductase [Lacticaseibacillus baoqingensis]
MSNVLILGANGQIARLAEQQLLKETKHHLTLFLRDAKRLTVTDPDRETVIEGDATDPEALRQAMANIDLVYANLGGSQTIETQAKAVVQAMDVAKLKRLIWISTLGIYDEVPGAFGKWNHEQLDGGYLGPYTKAAKVVEHSDLDYTIVRPAWLSNADTVDYELTHRDDLFKGTEVSRKSVADLVTKLINDPTKYVQDSLGVNQPHTDGAKPSFY